MSGRGQRDMVDGGNGYIWGGCENGVTGMDGRGVNANHERDTRKIKQSEQKRDQTKMKNRSADTCG